MASPRSRRANLEHSVSQIDLTRALEEIKIQEDTGMRYASPRSMADHPAENADIRAPNGVITPTNRILPKAPPPTPATPMGIGTPGSETPKVNGAAKSNGIHEDALEEVETQDDTSMRYTSADLMNYRTTGNADAHIPDGSIATTNGTLPSAPAPTSATLTGVGTPGEETPKASGVANVNEVVEDALKELPNGSPPKKKKKKKKRRRSGKGGGNKVSGFEEYYAEAPLNPDEYMEECDMYDVNLPFESRMQTCIQRYRGRRKLDETRSNILTKFLMLGGVEVTAKAFTGGLDKETLENSTAAEIAAIQASDYIRTDNPGYKYYDGSDKWVIDFEGVAKGFFSYRIPNMFPIDNQKQIEVYALTIRNFFNYILHHAACEDYKDDVFAARRICDLAEIQLWEIKQLRAKIPGDFNVAASTLYGGRHEGIHMGDAAWAVDDPYYKDFAATDRGFSVPEAQRIFSTAVAFAENDQLFAGAMNHSTHIVGSAVRFFEVVAIERPDLKTIDDYARVCNVEGNVGFIKPLGALKVKHWVGPQMAPEDLSDDEKEDGIDKDAVESYWLEDDLLQHCFTGMKLELVVKTLDIGIKFIDSFEGIYCSFFTYLPNEKMLYWKEPVENTRPPPTEDEPEVEENLMDNTAGNDLDEVGNFLQDA